MTVPEDVTVVIAAKNEAATIGEIVFRCRPYAREVLVVADCRCHDGTADRAADAGARVLIDSGRGKGHAMRMAIPAIATPITVFIDADGSHQCEDIPALVQPILAGEADHVSGSRLRGGSSELHGGFDEFMRLSGSSLITACINYRFGVRLSESQNGFRAIRTVVLQALGLTADSTTIEQEMIIRTVGLGYRMGEVPTHEYQRRVGVSNIRVGRAAPAYVWSLVKHLYFTSYPGPKLQAQVEPVGSKPSLDVDR